MVLRCKVVGWSETWGKWGNGRVFCFWLGVFVIIENYCIIIICYLLFVIICYYFTSMRRRGARLLSFWLSPLVVLLKT
jgi:hypothetical protein